MQIACSSCQSQIHADDMNLNTMVAKCRRCHALMGLNRLLSADASARGLLPVDRSKVPTPPGVTLRDSGSALSITRRWFGFQYVALAFFCIAWDSFLVHWYSKALTKGAPSPGSWQCFPLLTSLLVLD